MPRPSRMPAMRKFILIFILGIFCVNAAEAQSSPKSMYQVKATFSGAVKKVSPAVVNIFTETRVQKRIQSRSPFFNDPFFSDFFAQQPGRMKERVERSLGSGVVVSPDGYFVTNYHVVKDADAVKVVMHDGRELPAKLINAEARQDLAVMQLQLENNEKIPYANFGDSDSIEVGDVALAIGNPFGFGQSVSMGIISALGRTNIGSPYGAYIQTDAAINPGNSGGALIDSTGKVIGINTLIYSKTGGSQGLGFAVPSNVVKLIFESIKNTGKVVRPWFGATGQDVTKNLAETLNMPHRQGVLVNEITPNSPAAKSGIRMGDVILEIGGREISTVRTLLAQITTLPINQPIPAKVWREGRAKQLKIMFEELLERKPSARKTLKGSHPLNGYTVEELSPALNSEIEQDADAKGVAVIEAPKRANFNYGNLALRRGDIVQEINGKKIDSLESIEKALSSPSRSFQLVYKRGKGVYRMRIQR